MLVPLGLVSLPLSLGAIAAGPSNRMIVDCAVTLDASERRLFFQRIDAGPSFGTHDEASAGHNAGSQLLHQIFKNSPEAAATPTGAAVPHGVRP